MAGGGEVHIIRSPEKIKDHVTYFDDFNLCWLVPFKCLLASVSGLEKNRLSNCLDYQDDFTARLAKRKEIRKSASLFSRT